MVQLHQKYSDQKFQILAFPCNQFGKQEPGSYQEILEFVAKYNVQFPVFDKIDVKGPNAHPLFAWLSQDSIKRGSIKWNFSKFLLNRKGEVVDRFAPTTAPLSMEEAIQKLLAEESDHKHTRL